MFQRAKFVIFKPLIYCFDVKAPFASRLLISCLIRWYNKPGDITNYFEKRLFSSTGPFMDWKLQTGPGKITRPMLIGRAQVHKIPEMRPIFRKRIFWLIKKKKFDLQVFSRLGETMKKLQWILNTTVITSVLVIF